VVVGEEGGDSSNIIVDVILRGGRCATYVSSYNIPLCCSIMGHVNPLRQQLRESLATLHFLSFARMVLSLLAFLVLFYTFEQTPHPHGGSKSATIAPSARSHSPQTRTCLQTSYPPRVEGTKNAVPLPPARRSKKKGKKNS